MTTFSLHGIWQGRCIRPDGTSFAMDASVPGSSVADLIRAGRLPADLYRRDNAEAVLEYENCDYDYEHTFSLEKAADTEYTLHFHRLDTYCDIILNGISVASTMDGHIPYDFDVTDILRDGENRLQLHFTSPVTKVAGMKQYSGAFTTERMNTRRTQCSYGWDWVGRFVSCGVPGDVSLIARSHDEVRLTGTYVYTADTDEDSARIGVTLAFADPLPRRILSVTVLAPDGTLCRKIDRYVDEREVRMKIDIPCPALWYPLGYGKQPLYTLEISDGETVLRRESFGIRTVKILQIPDAPGSDYAKKCAEIKNTHYDFNDESSGFILKVNEKKILCRGANWVPVTPFYDGPTDQRITRILELSADAGVNMIRIWGGGTFETEHFYDECSRLGILVTQDFLMACGRYPEEEEWFLDCLRKEAEYAAHLMRNKACLMWYSGDNENAVNGCDTDEDYPGRRSARHAIGPVLAKLDPYREFLPSSPYGGKKYASNTVGTTHNTQFLGSDILPYMLSSDCVDYKDAWKKFRARFIAEEPQLGAVSVGTLRRFMTQEDIFGEDDRMWRYHTKTNPGLKTTIFDITLHFTKSLLGEFTSGEDRAFKLRYLQYEWVRLTMEQLRREMWFSSGLIYWMLNDCWPAASGWALIDYYAKPKDSYYAFKRCSAPVVISLDCADGTFTLTASNDGETTDALFTVQAVSKNGVRPILTCREEIPAASAKTVASFDALLREGEILVAEMHGPAGADRTFYRFGNLPLVPAEAELTVNRELRTATVRAKGYVHAAELEGNAVFSDNCFSLMPGEIRTVDYTPLEDGEGEIILTAYTLSEMQ